MLRQVCQVSLLVGVVASFAWAGNTVTTQQGEILTSPRSAAAGNLLFAFVTTQSGFDTEITISNTSQDTRGSIPQSGTCTLTFRGSGTVPAVQTTAAIPGGKQVVFLMSQGGGGIAASPNFQGYIAAQCTFPLARGVAKVTDLGARFLGFSQDAQVIALPRATTNPTNLLFPFATNQAGFDTGIAIANTSLDLGTTATAGSCVLSFFGSPAHVPVVTGVIAAGTVFATLVSPTAPGFQGYVIATCNFTGAAGLAFVSDLGARNIAFAETPEVLTVPRTATNLPLLFSAVTNQNGLDSTITIANTTSDPFGTTPVASACTLSFFGAGAPLPFVTPSIASGTVYTNAVSAMAPGFQGYVTASCGFPLARGYALIGDAGFRSEGDSETPELVTTPRSITPAPLLFSAVTSQNGDDTNITISNTSQDPFGTAQAGGTCTISYFGDMAGGGTPPSPQTSGTIAPGSQLSFTLSQNNAAQGIAATPGFRGYVIADCNFPLSRGLATVMPLPAASRVGTFENGLWLLATVTGGISNIIGFGGPTSTPVTGDWDGTGTSKVGVFDHGLWLLANAAGGLSKVFGFGSPTAIPVVGDWDGNGTTNIGVFDHGVWILANDAGGIFKVVVFGSPTAIPVVGDWDGTGTTKVGVFDHGLWILANAAGGVANVIGFGGPTATPVVGDWDGTGTTKIGVFDHGLWFLANSTGGISKIIGFGLATSKPVIGDWDGNGTANIGIFDNGLWFLANDSGGIFRVFGFGSPTATPVVGRW